MYKVLNKKYGLPLLAIVGGILMWLGWPTKPLAFFLFIGFVPLLLIEYMVHQRPRRSPGGSFFRYAYLFFLVWNAITTYWVLYSTVPGGIAAIVLNSLLMCIPAMAFYYTKRATNATIGYISFIVYWLGFEYVHLSWDLTWPWLTLGNGFAAFPEWVQWYEYTGFMGGSLWVLLVNLLVFLAFKPDLTFNKKKLILPAALVLAPILLSYLRYFAYEEKGELAEVVVVQPNVDPYKEKFPSAENYIPYSEQLARLIRLSEEKITSKTKFVAWPETALTEGYWEESLPYHPTVVQLQEFVNRHPGLELVTGIDTYKSYPSEDAASPTFRFREDIGYYDVFNAALHVSSTGNLDVYHKSKLVPGVEKLPYPGVFKFLGGLAIDLGGTVGSLGSQAERDVFFHKQNKAVSAAPVICYESIYGDFVSDYIRNGANLIFIITNDGWWSDSPGYKQHLNYARLRAIENRRSIARSANTGVSGFINQRGDILQQSEWWEQAALRGELHVNTDLTFYSRFGELIGTTAMWLSFILLPLIILKSIFYRNKM
ncbi:MAG: apolipoprotein N-acyltransferase [Hymenobacteraceae bacterium]|nr:apolipoprotein N-acyltransferase [Hymenobacteraceae bacterium]MDX5395766.1 apolipoprotein N-acyltransferase [Hymenobacteraceae bacterium]MDX5444045.1 apolipoprotein N-acyltransferase [Hymenobacteraceae bacterium]MDX5511821.1 apolipoprotein N-acyltransferase [Hymenobacteraceae bacterium]